jgi:two-component system LytT family sensor kinase
MTNLEKVLRIRHIYFYNLIFWFILCLFELAKTRAFILFFQYDFKIWDLVLWPFSRYLIYWALSFWIFNFYIRTRRKKIRVFISLHLLAGFLFALIHKIFADVAGVLIQRLLMGLDSANFQFLLERWQSLFFDIPVSILIYWMVILILLSLDYYKKFISEHIRSLELEHELNSAELNSLKMQLHPHFLFNAFNTISMMIRQKESDKAIRMINGLSDMLRQSLGKVPLPYASLREEIELVQKYLLIESERFRDRLEIIWDTDERILSDQIPAMLLQPIVENAFKHGISKSIGPAVLKIRLGRENGEILLEVFNTAPSNLLSTDFVRGKGVGLSNTVDRLMKLYQGAFKIQITEKDQGISVVIRIPAGHQISEKEKV